MQRFKNILFIADGSRGEKSALARAVDLAVMNKAKLTLMDVLDLGSGYSVQSIASPQADNLTAKLLDERDEELESLRMKIEERANGVPVDVVVDSGVAAIQIIRAVIRDKHDLVIKAPESTQGTFGRVFGSTDMKLMRKCPCAVWLAKPLRSSHYRTMLSAVDTIGDSDEARVLAEDIMTISTSLAALEKSDLHVVHAWRLPGEAKLRGRQISSSGVEELLTNMKRSASEQLNEWLSRFPYERQHRHLLKGRPGEVIPKLVRSVNADLLVMGTVGRTGIPGLFIGNTAEKVLNSVECSVLTLKPRNFKSPVED